MRRPDIELTDEAAAFVERNPDVIARLAGQSHGAPDEPVADTVDTASLRAQIRARLRTRIGECVAYSGTDEAHAADQAFLARYSG